MRRSEQWQQAEKHLGGPLETLLPPLVQDVGIKQAAHLCGAGNATVHRWMLLLGWRLRYVHYGHANGVVSLRILTGGDHAP